jgi:transaldolase
LADARPLRIEVFADCADLEGMLALAQDLLTPGFATNPTLTRRSAVSDYETFAKEVLAAVTGPDPVALPRGAQAQRHRNPLVAAGFDDCPRVDEKPREMLNVVQADGIGCHIVTVTHDLLKRIGVSDGTSRMSRAIPS